MLLQIFFVNRNGSLSIDTWGGAYSGFLYKDMDIKAADFEERLELALEDHRFFELLGKVNLPRYSMLIWKLKAQNVPT